MKIEISKFYKTQGGLRARIYAIDGGGSTPVHGAVLHKSGVWINRNWSTDGYYRFCNDDCLACEWIEPMPKLLAFRHNSHGSIVFFFDDGFPNSENYCRLPWMDESVLEKKC